MFYAQRLYAFSAASSSDGGKSQLPWKVSETFAAPIERMIRAKDVRLNGNDLVRHSPDWQRYLGNICRKWTSQGRRVVIFDRFHVRLSATGGGQLRAPDENPDDARFPLRIGAPQLTLEEIQSLQKPSMKENNCTTNILNTLEEPLYNSRTMP